MKRREFLIGLLAVPAGLGASSIAACGRKAEPIHVTYYYLPG